MSSDARLHAVIEAEHAVLGAALYDNRALERMLDLRAEHFADPGHQRIFAAIRGLTDKACLADPITVAARVAGDPAVLGLGPDYLTELYHHAPPIAVAEDHARVVADAAVRRVLAATASEIAHRAKTDFEHSGADIAGEAERELTELARAGQMPGNLRSMGEIAAAALQRARTRSGRIEFPFGLREVDAKTGGMNAGEVTVLGAWSGMGKTIAALQVAKANASARKGTSYFSLEMPEHSMSLRMMCDVAYDRTAPVYLGATSNPTMDAASKNQMNASQWARLDEAGEILAGWPLMLDDTPGYTVAQIEAIARRQHREWERQGIEPGPIIVDHLGKVRPSTNRRGDKTAETADISNGLAEMAKRLNVPVVALSQLNREVDKQGEDKRPNLSHIKQSSAIVEDARQVIFLYRPEAYFREALEHESMTKKAERLEKLEQVRGHFYWIVEKNNNGPKGQILTFCEAACSAVRDW